jgi:prolyl-tRNA editing enzyme YbaK/EbsC (Cys-tRNA(Pro) deacylase)
MGCAAYVLSTSFAGMTRIRFEGLRPPRRPHSQRSRAPLSSLGLSAQRSGYHRRMHPEGHPNVMRVADAARAAGVELDITRFPEGTRTAEDAARAIGCEVGQIVKSLVFMADGEPVVALVSGSDRVDTDRLAAAAGASSTRRASGGEARAATGYAIGGVPPFGHARQLSVLVDPGLLAHETVWAAAGLPDAVFPIAPETLVAASGGRVADVAATRDA